MHAFETAGGAAGSMDEDRLRYHLAVPYVAVIQSAEKDDGRWLRRAEYPELDGCAVEAPSAIEAMEQLEDRRVALIVSALARGDSISVPRPPLSGGACGLSAETLDRLTRTAAQRLYTS